MKCLIFRLAIVGLSYTAIIARQMILRRKPCNSRANLARWFLTMKARPSYAKAQIMDWFRFPVMFQMLWHGLLKSASWQ